jgi:HYR domain
MKRGLILVAIVAPLAVSAAAPSAISDSTGSLALNSALAWHGGDGVCPPGTPSGIECHPHPGGPALVPGLGEATQEYLYPVVIEPPDPGCKGQGGLNVADYPVRLVVKGKGEIHLSVKGISECLFGPPSDTVVNNTQSFTVSGGAGAFAGASGTGTVTHVARRDINGHAYGTDTWSGTLQVSGLEFDLTPPSIAGARSRVIRAPRRAKRVRVGFNVSAHDDVDGVVPVSCRPKSGSRFKIGRTTVRCSATDTSGNEQTERFTVRVTRRR